MTSHNLLTFDDVLYKYDKLIWKLTHKLKRHPKLCHDVSIEDIHQVVLTATWMAMNTYNNKVKSNACPIYDFSTYITLYIKTAINTLFTEITKDFYPIKYINIANETLYYVPNHLETNDNINSILESVHPELREILKDKYINNLSYRDMCKKYNMTYNQIKNRIHYAIKTINSKQTQYE